MPEIVIMTRLLVEDKRTSMRSSRCGITWMDGNEMRSVVFSPQEQKHSVRVMDINTPEFVTVISYIFVERWAKTNGIKVPYQVWRTHVDVWRDGTEVPHAYVKAFREEVQGKDRHRYAFEHIGGPQYVTPEFLFMELSSGSVSDAVCEEDLIPERKKYVEDYPTLYHPGIYAAELGILGVYEDILVRHKEAAPAWVM